MAGCKMTLFTLVVVCTFLAAYSLPPMHSLSKRSQKLCGRMLVQALALVCQSVYYDPNEYAKRSFSTQWADEQTIDYKGKQKTSDLLDSNSGNDLLSSTESFERGTRGIIDECCRKSCSVFELASYCE